MDSGKAINLREGITAAVLSKMKKTSGFCHTLAPIAMAEDAVKDLQTFIKRKCVGEKQKDGNFFRIFNREASMIRPAT